ncbi:hypothetical protein H5410_063138 [Solanum commersonii]|uniref:Uncharacterized protein n=1 Tax=Solanum commersonii TaxID=4109 RepID=A0A9J5WDK7_SOLCO|nr:hypothetical protein H5410_063138 [Solanum commersonii]
MYGKKESCLDSQVCMDIICIIAKAFQCRCTRGFLARKPGKYQPCNIFSSNSTCFHGASCILKSIHIVQVLTIQDERCKYLRSMIMRFCSMNETDSTSSLRCNLTSE